MASKITNNANGPRNINTSMGVVTLQPGESLGDDYEVSEGDLAAMKKFGLLDPADPASKQGGTSSLADVQREIASMATPAALSDGAVDDDGLLAADDDAVKALMADNKADDLRAIAEKEGVALEGDDNKTDMARKIASNRRG